MPNGKFQPLEVIRVVGEFVTRKKRRRLTGETGIIVAHSDPDQNGRRDYGVHFNAFGEMITVPEEHLESTGRIANRSEIVSRSHLHRRGIRANPTTPAQGH
jgi:hypothetical protein